jgi:methionyl-tRNA formyltransferase
LRIVYMGTAPFAVPSLEALVGAGHDVAAVVTQPDRPGGRGLAPRASSVKTWAAGPGLPILQPEKARDPEFVAALAALHPDLIVVVAYGQILKPVVLEIPPLGCVNVHGSLLPELRGAAPIQWAILRGYSETGVTTMFMDAGMDTGDVILQAREPIRPEDTAGDLAARLAPLGAGLLVETVRRIAAGDAPRAPQEHERATYAPLLSREDGAISWEGDAVSIRNRIHGCNPAPGAFALGPDGRVIKLWRAEVDETRRNLPGGSGEVAPGEILALDDRGVVVTCGRGALRLLEVQPESRPRQDALAYARGYRLSPGLRFAGG